MIDSELFPQEAQQRQTLRLFCFPHAGGGTSQFYRWRRYAPNGITIVPARLPGRESRLQQPPVSCIAEMATTVADTIASLPPAPYALLGYSVGAHLAYQVARRLPRQGEYAPQAMVVVASNPPGVKGSSTPAAIISELPDEQLVDHIHQKYGGIPAVVRRDPEWLAVLIPALRADLRMLESHPLEPGEPLACPLLAIGGLDDAYVSVESLARWSSLTRGELTTRQFPGGHFFLYSDGDASGPAASSGTVANIPAPLATVFQFVQRGEVSSAPS